MKHTLKNNGPRRWIAATCLLGAGVALSGCHIDMWVQPKMKPYYASDFFADKQANRPLVVHTVPQGGERLGDPIYYTGYDDAGKVSAKTPVRAVKAFVSPKAMLLRGQDRYNAYCSPCHSRVGNGNGYIMQRGLGYWQKLAASYHTDRLRKVGDGYLYDVVVNGHGVMYGYGSRIQNVDDRWAVVNYVRALQYANNPAAMGGTTPAGAETILQNKEQNGTVRGNDPSGNPLLESNPNNPAQPTRPSGSMETERPLNRTPGGPAPAAPPGPNAPNTGALPSSGERGTATP